MNILGTDRKINLHLTVIPDSPSRGPMSIRPGMVVNVRSVDEKTATARINVSGIFYTVGLPEFLVASEEL
jgi:hypothetical protein